MGVVIQPMVIDTKLVDAVMQAAAAAPPVKFGVGDAAWDAVFHLPMMPDFEFMMMWHATVLLGWRMAE